MYIYLDVYIESRRGNYGVRGRRKQEKEMRARKHKILGIFSHTHNIHKNIGRIIGGGEQSEEGLRETM